MNNLFCRIAVCWLLLMLATPLALAQTILYVPADDRPVSLDYAVDTVKTAIFDVLSPPAEYLAGRGRKGDPEKLWQWVNENAHRADAMVLSADSLLYGGLVDSRLHDFSYTLVEWRFKRFSQLREKNLNTPMYVFSTIMRSPKASAGGMEPPYYEAYGKYIFQLTALQDKAELQPLTAVEENTLRSAQQIVPAEYLTDWMNRRNINFKINVKLIELIKAGTFNYLIVGRDDTSPFSQSNKEARKLSKLVSGLGSDKYSSFPGADQLGMVLLARAYNNLTMQVPKVAVQYALGAGADTVPSYEDQPIGRTITDHIIAAGGVVTTNSPDLILAVNTPLEVTPEAEDFDNLPIITNGKRQFVAAIESAIRAGTPVAVADVAFANGADNAFMQELARRNLLNKLTAYSGWNTASNSLGYAIGQGMLLKTMSTEARQRLLIVRYLEDWGYQGNIRKAVDREVLYPQGGSLMHLDQLEPELATSVEKEIGLFAAQHLWVQPDKIRVSFPWNRMFEIKVEVQP